MQENLIWEFGEGPDFSLSQKTIRLKAFDSCMRYLFAASAINMSENKEKEDSLPMNSNVLVFL